MIMKKIVKTVILVAAFTTATIFMSCSDAISEDEQEQNLEESAENTVFDSTRCGFGGHYGRTGGDSISNSSNSRRGHGRGNHSSAAQ